ncbi:MAG: helix-turn-helix domain-containing protein, partial [Blastocatellia bacterium]
QELTGGAAGIDQIAGAVGYQDTAHFRALFRKYTGLTPSDYRKRTRVALEHRAVSGAMTNIKSQMENGK